MKPYRNKAYLKWVREQPCLVCYSPMDTQAHHIKGLLLSGMGIKGDDSAVIPVCPTCHSKIHEDSNFYPLLDQVYGSYKLLIQAIREGKFNYVPD